MKLPPTDSDCTSDLSQWYHCASNKGVPDSVISQAWETSQKISFMFHHRSSQAEIKPEEAVEKVGQKKKKPIFAEDSDEDYDDQHQNDHSSDEDFVL